MSLWNHHTKPKNLSTAEKSNVAATSTGWVKTNADGTKETLVAINRLTDKQKPKIVAVTTNATSYDIKTAPSIIFTVSFQFPITASTLTAATVLAFTIGLVPLEATFTSSTATTLVFTYTIPVATEDKDAIMATGVTVTSVGLTDITLNTAEIVTLNNSGYTGGNVINAVLTFPTTSLPVTITRTV